MSRQIEVSVILVNYNCEDMILHSIQSLQETTTDINYEIIVVDNSSNAKFAEKLRKIPKVIYLDSMENIGFGRANNLGAAEAKGKYLYILGSDTIVCTNVLKQFCQIMQLLENKEKIGVLGSTILDSNKKDVTCIGPFVNPNKFMLSKLLFFGKKILGLDGRNWGFLRLNPKQKNCSVNHLLEVEGYLIGCSLFMAKNVFLKLDGFDDRFFMYSEDLDLQYRMKKLGLKSYLVKDAEIIHFSGGSFDEPKSNKRRIMRNISAIRYYHKNHGLLAANLLRMTMISIGILDTLVDLFKREYSFQDNISHICALSLDNYFVRSDK